MNLYSHVTSSMQREAAEKIGGRYSIEMGELAASGRTRGTV
jgi:hypothetical protein